MDVMWGFGIPSYLPQNIHILYVDHDSTHDSLLKDMFACFSCEVTIVKLASTALAILAKGNFQFDIVMENIHSPDRYGFKLLHDATRMDLPVILLTDGDDPSIIMKGIEEGAMFCIQKPVTMELIRYLWQHVLREKIRKIKDNQRVRGLMTHYEYQNGTRNEPNNIQQYSESVKKVRNGKNLAIDDGVIVEEHYVARAGKKDWTEWTPELHGKFMDAVMQLGEGRCYPKEILELMNVPGLTRMQVASHLQKCRSGDWQINHQRRHYPDYDPQTTPVEFKVPPARSRRFGTMPRVELVPQPGFNVHQNSSKNTVVEAHNACDQSGMNEQVPPQSFVQFGDVIEIEGTGHVGLSFNGMLMSDAQSIFDAHSGTSTDNSSNNGVYCNGQLQELAEMDNQMLAGQVSFVSGETTGQGNHGA